jgi:hypothetical protein
MNSYRNRLIQAIKLDPSLYEEVEADPTAINQAILTVFLSCLAAGIGGLRGGIMGVVVSATIALLGWFAWAYLTYIIGTKLLPEPQTSSTWGEILRCTGFASAPGFLQILCFLPGLGPVVRLIASVWMLAAFVVAVRQALDYSSTFRALGACVIGWLVLMALNALLFIMSLGAISL